MEGGLTRFSVVVTPHGGPCGWVELCYRLRVSDEGAPSSTDKTGTSARRKVSFDLAEPLFVVSPARYGRAGAKGCETCGGVEGWNANVKRHARYRGELGGGRK